MRKGMLFFSQYRTLRRIFLKNLKKYLRFVGPYRPGAFFLQDGVLRPTVWPLLCSDECGPGSGGIGSVGPGGPVPPQIPAGRFAGTGVCCFTGAGVCCGPLLVCRDGCTLFCPTGPSLFCGVDARRFAGANAHCFVGPGALTGIFRTFVPEAVPCFWRRTR